MVMEIEKLSEERGTPVVSVIVKKKKRNLPGMPDPDAEVIALSPKTLMATNRFVCEICSKGFQRDQNLQLHRRGHNLPWKLKQRSSVEAIRKRVYVCPEPACVHHDPSRALGDLTGIKKHFSRKHGEKKWKCDKCSKKYAVHSDWKAHFKTCGTREYRCDCGTFFSRRDSFITHRAFCDALAGESGAKIVVPISIQEQSPKLQTLASSPPTSHQNGELGENCVGAWSSHQIPPGSSSSSTSNKGSSLFANVFASSAIGGSSQPQPSKYSHLLCAMAPSECPITEPTSLSLSSNSESTPFALEDGWKFAPPTQPTMSATALLQKAAEMGATANGGSFLTSLGVSLSSSSSRQWNNKVESNPGNEITDGNTRLTELMIPPSTTTLDFLGLGMGGNCTSKGGFLALLTSIGGDLQVAKSFRDKDLSREDAWEGGNERASNAS